MQMLIAGLDQLEKVYNIVRTTIEEVYPHYYPAGAVTFFLSHQQHSHIEEGLRGPSVYLFAIDGQAFATGTERGNDQCRFLVLPPYQGQGYGREIMDQLEQLLWKKYNTITLDASLPALSMYRSRGYREVAYTRLLVDGCDYLCYWTMELKKDS